MNERNEMLDKLNFIRAEIVATGAMTSLCAAYLMDVLGYIVRNIPEHPKEDNDQNGNLL